MTQPAFSVEFDEQKIDAIFAGVNQCRLPGAAVGIALHGRPVYRKGFGLAHMEVPLVLSASMRMRIHSTTKHFTCLAYLLLCEAGQAGVDDPIGKYFPELKPVTRSVTARQLMGNVSGLRNPVNLRWELGSGEREIPIEELLATYRDIEDVNFASGSAFDYNNSGFELLAVAVERITGRRFEDVLRTRIFEPVGMIDTMLRRVDSDFVPNSATMHMKNAAGQYVKTYLPGTVPGSAGIVSTVDDMLRWLKHMNVPVVGSAETWRLMTTPQILANGTATSYGCGLVNTLYRGIATVSHDGRGMGANSQMLKVPGAGLDIVVMANREDVSAVQLTERILDACLPDLDPVAQAPERERPTGVFRSPTAPIVIQFNRPVDERADAKTGPLMATINGMAIPMAFDRLSKLRPAVAGLHWLPYAIEMVGEAAKPRALRFSDFGTVHTLEPVERLKNADTSRILGRYLCKGISTEAAISESNDQLQLAFTGRWGAAQYKLRSLADGVWTATQLDIYPRKGLLYFDQGSRSFGYVSYSTHYSPLRFERLA